MRPAIASKGQEGVKQPFLLSVIQAGSFRKSSTTEHNKFTKKF
jgi:hypothetical protein